MKLITRCLLAILVAPATAAADGYYVAPDGNDNNPGTVEKPFRTLNWGVKTLKPGDTLVVREGVYRESLWDNIPSGASWGSPVSIKAAPGEKVILRPDDGAARVMDFYLKDGKPQQYIVVEGLVLNAINVKHDCVKIHNPAHHLRFVGCEIKNAANQGILTAHYADGCEYLNLLVHDNGIREGAHGLYLGGRRVRVEGCRIYNNAGNALRNAGLHDSVIAYNTIHHNGRRQVSPAVEFHGTGNVMHHNLLYANRSGIAIVVRAPGKIYHNTLVGKYGYGIYLASGRADAVHVANNVIVGTSLMGLFNDTSAANSVVENNLVFGHPYNLENRAKARTWRNNQEADPRFVDAARRDYRLAESSPARDAGVRLDGLRWDLEGRPRLVGAAPDRGAYEFDRAAKAPARNLPPEVSADPDLVTTMASPTVTLVGTVADDGLPSKPVTASWKS